jgi:hypothetical protein
MTEVRTLSRALGALVALSLATTALVRLLPGDALPPAAAGGLLALAALKADVILTRYLGLADSPSWRRGFRAALVLLMIALFGLYLIPLMP